jgi:uncharacterized membrane protein
MTGPGPPDAVAPELPANDSGAPRFPLLDCVVLIGLVALFVYLLTGAGQLRYENFYTTNWDLGINQQMLWSTTHGRLLYETGDAEFYNVGSYLLVHSTYIALLVAPIYDAAPYPATLFAIQAAAFAASVLPLYLLARPLIRSRTVIFLVLALFLSSFAVISSLLYDFHWEAFLPVEFLTFWLLLERRLYWYALVVLAIGCVTLEVFPFLAAAAAVLLLYIRVRELEFHPRAWFRDRQIRIGAGLLVLTGVAYIAIRLAEFLLIPALIGGPAHTSQAASGIAQPISVFAASGATLGPSLLYWLLLLASFAFLPLLAPRYLIPSLPWIFVTIFADPQFSAAFGTQYALVAATTLGLPLVYGAARFERIAERDRFGVGIWILLLAAGAAAAGAADVGSARLLSGVLGAVPLGVFAVPVVVLAAYEIGRRVDAVRRRRARVPIRPPRWNLDRRHSIAATAGVAALFVVFNLLMSPVLPANYNATPNPGYWYNASPNPSAAEMGWLTHYIPDNAVLLASDRLFPYVANNVNAWAVPWFPVVPGEVPRHLPFNGTNLPPWVLIDSYEWYNFPTSVRTQLWNSSVYGLVAYIFAQGIPGSIYLFEVGYHGPAQGRAASTIPAAYFFTAANLSLGSNGLRAADNASRFGEVIESDNGLTPTGPAATVWYGPYVALLPGNYSLTVNLTGGLNPGANASTPILFMDGGFADLPPFDVLYSKEVYASDLNGTNWTSLHLNITIDQPYPLLEFRGYQVYTDGKPDGWVRLNYVEVGPDPR